MDGETSEDHVHRLAQLHDSSDNLCDIQKRRSFLQLLCRRKLEWVNMCNTMNLRSLDRIFNWISGALVLSGLWMIDEIITLAKYCGRDCLYPIPLIGTFEQYAAEGIAWVLIFAGIAILFRREK